MTRRGSSEEARARSAPAALCGLPAAARPVAEIRRLAAELAAYLRAQGPRLRQLLGELSPHLPPEAERQEWREALYLPYPLDVHDLAECLFAETLAPAIVDLEALAAHGPGAAELRHRDRDEVWREIDPGRAGRCGGRVPE